MITIGEATESVILDYNRGRKSRDNRLSASLVYGCLINARATLIRQQSNKKQNINHWIYQTLPCVEMEMQLVEEDNCMMLRSKYPLPKLISDAKLDLLGAITTDIGRIRFERSYYENIKYRSGSKYLSNKPACYLQDGYLYITKTKFLKKVKVPGIFEDAIEVFNFPNYCDTTDYGCQDYNQLPFPIDRDLLETIIDMASKQLAQLFLQTSDDERIDSIDDTGLSNKMIHDSK